MQPLRAEEGISDAPTVVSSRNVDSSVTEARIPQLRGIKRCATVNEFDRRCSGNAAADGKIGSSQRGLPAGSAVALGTAVTKWQADTSALY